MEVDPIDELHAYLVMSDQPPPGCWGHRLERVEENHVSFRGEQPALGCPAR